MAAASGVRLAIRMADVPVLPGARELGVRYRPGGTASNEGHFGLRSLAIDEPLDAVTLALLFDPQTSGGLLASVAPEEAERLVAAMRDRGLPAAVIGGVRALAPGETARPGRRMRRRPAATRQLAAHRERMV